MVDLRVSMFTMFEMKYLEFPLFDFLHSWQCKKQTYKFQICRNNPGDPLAYSDLLAVELTAVNFTFGRMVSNTFEKNCPLVGDLFYGRFLYESMELLFKYH